MGDGGVGEKAGRRGDDLFDSTDCCPLTASAILQPQDWDIAATVRLIEGFDAEGAAGGRGK